MGFRARRGWRSLSEGVIVCANGKPAHLLAQDQRWAEVKYLDNLDGAHMNLLAHLVELCTCEFPEGCR
ncbi:hypothetical protein [Bailinhaonella thermotolerans]|uniref:hypothetical protein n=1 Tax=Bailinhaonella thermotolerans TaxID=1070861 RepID=UPI00192A1BAA|nr:hypothetical protein [Bailinhaonella thermotolerans]